jgi:hypothetical protein
MMKSECTFIIFNKHSTIYIFPKLPDTLTYNTIRHYYFFPDFFGPPPPRIKTIYKDHKRPHVITRILLLDAIKHPVYYAHNGIISIPIGPFPAALALASCNFFCSSFIFCL